MPDRWIEPFVRPARSSRARELAFLDVEMPECDGFDVLEMAGGELPANVFVTA